MKFHFLNNDKLFLVVFNKLVTNKIDVCKQLFKSCFCYFIFALMSSSAFAVDITLDNNPITEVAGDGNLNTCLVGDIYRIGTTNSFNGQSLAILVEITDEDNEYDEISPAGPCISVAGGILDTRLRDRDVDENAAFMDLKITVINALTGATVEVDRIVFSGFDLDSNGASSNTGGNSTNSDDIYMISPSRGYIESGGFSNVTYSEGSFTSGYDVRLEGQTTGNCNDSASNPEAECRGGGISVFGSAGANRVTEVNIRVANNNAYGLNTGTTAYRLIQISFKEADFNQILNNSTDHGDIITSDYGDAFHDVSVFTVLGFGEPADDENSQGSAAASLDDQDPIGQNFDDEDGVRVNGQATSNSSLGLIVGTTNSIEVTTIGTGYLSAWLDININDDFDEPNEKVLDDFFITSVIAQDTTISVVIPPGNNTGTSYARFRFSQNANIGSDGAGGIGEVEDYQVEITPGGNIVGHLYLDTNGNGIQEDGVEPDLAGVTVVITDEVGTQTTVVTNANGDYTAIDIRAGDATVDIDQTDPDYPAGSIQTDGSDPTVVTVIANQDNIEEDNGFFVPGIVSGSVNDGSATGILNVTVQIQDGAGNVIDDLDGNPLSTTTNASGDYSFTNVPSGDYFIVETDLATYVSISDGDASADGDAVSNTDTNDNSIPVTITSGKNDVGNNFVDAEETMVDLSIIKKVDNATANVGDTITFILEVSNAGPDEATDVNITDIVPAGFTYVAGSMTGISPIVTGITPDESNPDSGTGLSWTITSLISGTTTTLTFQADVQAP
ncbi:MAG: SdrD B-like domain-containing protein [Cocleimonas sp.]